MSGLYNTTVIQLLQEVGHISSFLKLEKLTTIEQTLHQLQQDNIRFAAVFDGPTFLGTVDVFDIIYYLLAYS